VIIQGGQSYVLRLIVVFVAFGVVLCEFLVVEMGAYENFFTAIMTNGHE
jgi:hypothetical protein